MARKSFIFYHSFYEALQDMPDDERLCLYDAIAYYSFTLEEPDLQGICATIFKLIKPQLEANNKKYENGKKGANHGQKGGRPSPKEPLNNPTKTPPKPQANRKETPNVNENVNVNVNDKGDCKGEGRKKKGCRLSIETLPTNWREFCLNERPDLKPEEVFNCFRDYWISKAGKDGVKLDWLATWRNWVRSQRREFKPRATAPAVRGKNVKMV